MKVLNLALAVLAAGSGYVTGLAAASLTDTAQQEQSSERRQEFTLPVSELSKI